jgi:prepilin signal peptidase PulO-like enzyme (type II secretory pathway)
VVVVVLVTVALLAVLAAVMVVALVVMALVAVVVVVTVIAVLVAVIRVVPTTAAAVVALVTFLGAASFFSIAVTTSVMSAVGGRPLSAVGGWRRRGSRLPTAGRLVGVGWRGRRQLGRRLRLRRSCRRERRLGRCRHSRSGRGASGLPL